ncbi:hypothetical protein B0H14DRAFT_3446909 [Mycena olivaceomarginata]|nr:hypothetical protein B0H14DRAFT_3446909 [Mycena olivaceomarginata]
MAENLYAAIAGGLSYASPNPQYFQLERRSERDANPTSKYKWNLCDQWSCTHTTPSVHNLAVLILASPVGFDIEDAAAWDMAPAWPNLVRLVLGSAMGVRCPPAMTLHGLRVFAEHCKALKFLAITVDVFTVPPLDNSPQTRIPQQQLCSFDVAKSPIPDARTVSRFLSSLFPDLSEVRTHNEGFWEDRDSDDEDEETTAARSYHTRWKWKEVEGLIPIRRQECAQ